MAVQPDFMAKLPPLTRLATPDFEPRAAEAYRAAIDAIDRAGVPYLVGGALALNAYSGVWRDTRDLDVFIRPHDAGRALDALAAEGFDTQTIYESWLGKAWRSDVYVDLIWRNANGLFPVRTEWSRRAARLQAFGRDMPVLPLEELVVSKMMVMGRYRFDGADILHILAAARRPIDWDHLERIAGEHVGLLLAQLHIFRWAYPGLRDKVPDAVIDRYSMLAREAPSSFGPFRGRLIDIQSFEVDVRGWGLPDPHRAVLEGLYGDAEGRS